MRSALDRDQATSFGFEQFVRGIGPAQLARGVEVIGRVLAKVNARGAVATKSDHDAIGRVRPRKLDPLDQRRGLGQQIFAGLFLARHENLASGE